MVLKHPLLRFGMLLWFMFFVFVVGIVASWGNPIAMSVPALRLLLVSTGIAIALGVVYHERTWCLFCPMGTLANAVNRLAKLVGRDVEPQVTIDGEACTDCLRCQSVCRQQIRPNEHKHDELVDHGDVFDLTARPGGNRREPATPAVDHGDCLKCGYCVDECPTGALRFEGEAAFETGSNSTSD